MMRELTSIYDWVSSSLINFKSIISVTLILISSNSVLCHSYLEQEFTITFAKFVKVNDSTRIIVESNIDTPADYQFKWQTNFGTIESFGKVVRFVAPDTVCVATLGLEIYSKTDLISTRTFDISVSRQLIILKADDLIYDDKTIISNNWTRFFHFVVSEKIKASAGIICNSLETDDERYFGLLRYLDKTGYIELWNHGYDHILDASHTDGTLYDEFRNSSFEFQKEQLRKAQTLAKEKLNITLQTFGAPGNAIDNTTIQALEAFDEIKVWFFGLSGSDKLVLGRSADMEYPAGKPDYNSFVQNYDTGREYLVLQIHPNQWDESQFETFKQIIEFLKEQQSVFILPYEYYSSVVTKRKN
jgi:peptidoglycan/xylan/chitin deacetylase (PgdA/CDA1 family)